MQKKKLYIYFWIEGVQSSYLIKDQKYKTSCKERAKKWNYKRANHSFSERESEFLYDLKPKARVGRFREPQSPIRAQLRKNNGLMQFRKVQHLRRKSCTCTKCGNLTKFEVKVGLLPTQINQHEKTFNCSLLKIHTRGPSTPPGFKSSSLTIFENFKSVRALTPVLTKKNFIDILRKEVRRQSFLREKSPLVLDSSRSSLKQLRLSPRPKEEFLRPEEKFSFQEAGPSIMADNNNR